MKGFKFNSASIGNNQPIFFIAEIGLNHNGDVAMAEEMISAAAESGATAVKFQTFKTEEFIAHDSPYFDIFKSSELTSDEFLRIKQYADTLGIIFFSTPFDFGSVDLLNELSVPIYKIASCDLTNLPLIRYVAKKNKPIVISAGMGSVSETAIAIEACKAEGNEDLAILHCVAHYPADPGEMNLRTIPFMSSLFGLPVGLSDHTVGIEIPTAAIALGAQLIEKHFTLDKSLPGPDHQLSTTPSELRQLVDWSKLIQPALGSLEKEPPETDQDRELIRRSLVSRSDIPAGTTITPEIMAIKRPGDGIPPMFYNYLIGRKTKLAMKQDERFHLDNLV